MIRRLPLLLLLLAACSTPNSLTTTLTEITNTDALAGGSGRLRVTRGNAAASAVVKLASSNPDVATVPASVTLQEGETSAEVEWQGVSVGTAVFTATLGKSSVDNTARVVSSRRPSEFSFDWDRVQLGASTTVSLYLSAVLGTDDVMTCSSSNEEVVSVPEKTPVPAWSSNGIFSVTAMAPGVATITCELGGVQVSDTLSVVNDLQLEVFLDNLRGEVGSTVGIDVYLNAVPADAAVVTLTSSAPNVIAVPSEVIIEDATYAPAIASVLGVGSALITMKLGDQTSAVTVSGIDKPHLWRAAFSDARVTAGTPVSLNVGLDAYVGSQATATLASSDDSVLSVPASLQIARNRQTANTILVPKKAGTAVVTTTLNGDSLRSTLSVAAQTSITGLDLGDAALAGVENILYLFFDAKHFADQAVMLTSSNPSVLAVPAAITLVAGESSVAASIRPLAAGQTTVTASLNGSSFSLVVTVADAVPSLIVNASPDIVLAGDPLELRVSAGLSLPTATTVTLTSSNPAVLTVPATIDVPPNTYNVRVPLTAGGVGHTQIVAQAGASTAYASLDVLPAPKLGNIYSDTLQWGAVAEITTYITPAVKTDTTLTTIIGDPTLLEVLTLPKVPAGGSSVTFLVRAKNKSGTTPFSLKLGDSLANTQITTQETPQITIAPVSPRVGRYTNVLVSADCALADAVLLSFASTNTNVVTVHPSSVLLTPSNNGAVFALYGVTGGTGDITVTGPAGVTGLTPFSVTVTP